MNTGDALIRALMNTVQRVPLERPHEDFVTAAFALLALALSKLPPERREVDLQWIEDGDLRRAVERFEACRAAHNRWVQ